MSKTLRKIGAIMILGVSICSFLAGCGQTKETNNTDNNVNNTLVDDEEKTTTISRLDKSNAIIINHTDDDYDKTSSSVGQNDLKAETYLNKTFKITGEVYRIRTENNKIRVTLCSPNRVYNVILEFDDTEENRSKLIDLTLYDRSNKIDGDIITVYGYGSRFDSSCLVLSECEFA